MKPTDRLHRTVYSRTRYHDSFLQRSTVKTNPIYYALLGACRRDELHCSVSHSVELLFYRRATLLLIQRRAASVILVASAYISPLPPQGGLKEFDMRFYLCIARIATLLTSNYKSVSLKVPALRTIACSSARLYRRSLWSVIRLFGFPVVLRAYTRAKQPSI